MDGNLVTSRQPSDIPAFIEACLKILENLQVRAPLSGRAVARIGAALGRACLPQFHLTAFARS